MFRRQFIVPPSWKCRNECIVANVLNKKLVMAYPSTWFKRRLSSYTASMTIVQIGTICKCMKGEDEFYWRSRHRSCNERYQTLQTRLQWPSQETYIFNGKRLQLCLVFIPFLWSLSFLFLRDLQFSCHFLPAMYSDGAFLSLLFVCFLYLSD